MQTMPQAQLNGFLDELQAIEKEAGWLGKGLAGLALAGSLGGAGVKAMRPAAQAVKPVMSQMGAIAKAPLPKATSLPGHIGSRSSQFADPSMRGVMP